MAISPVRESKDNSRAVLAGVAIIIAAALLLPAASYSRAAPGELPEEYQSIGQRDHKGALSVAGHSFDFVDLKFVHAGGFGDGVRQLPMSQNCLRHIRMVESKHFLLNNH